MTYPSKTPAARKKESAERREREREQLAAVNAKLAQYEINWKELMVMIVNDEVEIKVKEKRK